MFLSQPLTPETVCAVVSEMEVPAEILPVSRRGCEVETGATTGGVASRAAT